MKPIVVRNLAALWLSVFAVIGVSGCSDGPVDPVSYALGVGGDDATNLRKLKPLLEAIEPADATGGDTITLSGKNFGKKAGLITVQGVEVATQSWTATQVTFVVPNDLPGGASPVVLQPDGGAVSAPLNLNLFAFLKAASPAKGDANDVVTLTGHNFGASHGEGRVRFGKAEATVSKWSNDSIQLKIPATVAASKSAFAVTVGGLLSNEVPFTLQPGLTKLTPATGPPGTSVTLTGTGFGAKQGSNTLLVNGQPVTVTKWAATSITFVIPAGSPVSVDSVSVRIATLASNDLSFSVTQGAPVLSTLLPASGTAGSSVVLTGVGFGDSQGTSTLTVGGVFASATTWSATSVSFVIPASLAAGAHSVVLTVGGKASNAGTFTVVLPPVPAITSVSPASGFAGTLVTVNGSNFGATQGASTLKVGTTGVTPQSWSATQIKFSIPATGLTAGSRPVSVTVQGQTSNAAPFSVRPSVVTVTPSGAPAGSGALIGIEGLNFGTATPSSRVFIGGVSAPIVGWSDTTLSVTLPGSLVAGTHRVLVTVGGQASNATTFRVLPTGGVSIDGLTPDSGLNEASIFVTGSGFGATQGSSTVTVGGVSALASNWTDGSFDLAIPAAGDLVPGSYDVIATVNGQASNAAVFTVFSGTSPQITAVSPISGVPGDSVVLSGINFGAFSTGSTVTIGGLAVVVTSWSNSSIAAQVPPALSAGRQPIVVTVGGEASNTAFYTVTPLLSSVSPVSGPVGAPIVLTGVGFGASQGPSIVTVGGFTATVSAWSNSSITAFVPLGVATGLVAVQLDVSGQLSNPREFTVQSVPAPAVASVSPGIGGAGTLITVTGSNFGAVQGLGDIRIGGTIVTPTSWSSSSITLQLPASIAPGTSTVVVTAAGQTSTAGDFVVLPVIDTMNPTGGSQGLQVTLSGTNFGTIAGSVQIGGVNVVPTTWNNGTVTFAVPTGLPAGAQDVNLFAGGQYSNTLVFTSIVNGSPVAYSVTPVTGLEGITAVLTGANFGATQGTSTLVFGGATVTPVSWTATNIQFVVPSVAPGTYAISVSTGTAASNAIDFAVTTTTSPQISSLSPTSGLRGATVTIAGQFFGASAGTVTIGGITATVSSWSATSISATIPSSIATGSQPVIVVAGGVASNTEYFSVRPVTLLSLSPVSGPVGATVTATGSGFGAPLTSSILSVGGTSAVVGSWNDTTIVFTVPAAAAAGDQPVVVIVGGQASNALDFEVTGVSAPLISSVTPSLGTAQSQITLAGVRFGAGQGTGIVTLGGATVPVVSWSNSSIVITVPATIAAGNLTFVVTTGAGASSNAAAFTLVPTLSTRAPVAGPVLTTVTLTGSNFGAAVGASLLSFDGDNVTPSAWSDESIAFSVPAGLTPGSYAVSVNVGGQPSNSVSFQVTSGSGPVIASVSPSLVAVGATVTVSGNNFGASIGLSTLSVSGSTVTPVAWSDTAITFTAPNLPTGNYPVVVSVGGNASNPVSFAIQSGASPVVTSVAPAAGPRGAIVTVNGAGFGAFQDSSGVTFDGTAASVQSWSATAIQVVVPNSLTAGSRLVQVTVSGTASNTVEYTVRPLLTALSPTSGEAGMALTLTGSAFGAVVSDSTVLVEGGAAIVQTWSDTSVVVTVPGGLALGAKNVLLVVSGQPSNAMAFSITGVTSPVVSSMSPANATVGQTITLTGGGFGSNQGSGTITIGGVTLVPTSWTDDTIVFVVPPGTQAGDQDVIVTVLGEDSNLGTLTIAPGIDSASPLTGTTGAVITLTGTSFGSSATGSSLLIGGILVTPTSWTDTAITFVIPSAVTAGTNAIEVIVAGEPSNTTALTVTPSVTGIDPVNGASASLLTIDGTNFGDLQAGATVTIGGVAAQIASWTASSVSVTVPTLPAGSHDVVVTVGGETSNNGTFHILPAITGLSPSAGTGTTLVTLAGTSFGAGQGSSTVALGGVVLTPNSWSDTSIEVAVPTTLVAGFQNFVVVVNGETSAAAAFAVQPYLASISPTSGGAGTSVGVAGTNFGPSAATSTVTIGGILVTPTSWSNTAVSFVVPASLGGGAANIVLTVGGQASNAKGFTAQPAVSSISPVAGSAGAPVRLGGNNFGSSQGGSTVLLNGATVGILGWSSTAVTFQVPASAVAGRLAVALSVGGQAANPVSFTVVPVIDDVVSPGGPAGTGVTLSGHHFGTSGRLTVDGRTVAAASWSNTTITFSIPGDLAAGDVGIVVTSANQPSNRAVFTVTAPGAPASFGMTPVSASTGTVVTLTGMNFNPVTGSTITIGGVTITPDSWSDGTIVFTVPPGLPAGTNDVVVTVGGIPSNGLTLDIIVPGSPYISSTEPAVGASPSTILIEGTGFGPFPGGSTITVDGVPVPITSWDPTDIIGSIPGGLPAGEHEIVITVGGAPSNTIIFTVRPTIGTATPSGGAAGTLVTLTGTSFGATQGTSTIIIAGVEVTATSWSDGTITFVVPNTIASGPETIYVEINGQPSNAVDFNVTSASGPVFTGGGSGGTSGIAPVAGAPGTLVTLTGERFGSAQGGSTLTINGIDLIVVDWSNLEVTARIPSGIDAGIFDVVMTVDAQASNTAAFTVLPAIGSVSPSGGPVGTSVTIAGDAFGTAQGASTLSIGGVTVTATSWSRTAIVATVPPSAVTGTSFVTVVVDGQSSNAVPFVVTASGAPSFGGINPASGPAGTVVTITGTGFGDPQGTSTITIGGVTVVPTVWEDGTITFTIPPLPSGTADIVITVNGIPSNTGTFVVGDGTAPGITGVVPSAGPASGSLTITGTNFGALQGSSSIRIGGILAAPSSWSDTSLVVAVPTSLAAGIHTVKVTVGGVTSNTVSYAIRPSIDSLTPDFGATGVTVAVAGHSFGAVQNASQVTVGGLAAAASSWSDTAIVLTIPGGLTVGAKAVVVTIANEPSNSASFNVTSSTAPAIGSSSSTVGVVGDSITLTGTNFGPLQGGSTITVGGITATVTSWSNTSITYIVPTGTQAGNQPVEVTVGGQVSNTPDITISPAVTGTAPSDATGGTLVSLTGTSFGATPGTLVIGGVTVVPSTWSDTGITFVLPSSIAGGDQDVNVTANGETSAAATLTVHPGLTSLSPASVTSGTVATLVGTNFGSTEGTSTVTIDGTPVTVTSWSSTGIVFTIPTGLAAGSHSLQATVGGETGTALAFTVEPAITGLNVLNGTADTVVTLTGTSFGSPQGVSTLSLGGVTLTPTLWADGSITVTIPSSVKAGVQSFVVTVNGEVSDAAAFTVKPSLGTVAPSAGTTATSITVSGTNFGNTATGSTITIGGVAVTATAWSTTSITFVVPSLPAGDQNIEVVVGGQTSDTAVYTVQPWVGSVAPGSATGGTVVTITGTSFGPTDVGNGVTVGGIAGAIVSWTDTEVKFSMPNAVTGGTRSVVVTVNGEASTVGSILVIPAITSPSPVSGPTGTPLTLAGAGFGGTQGTSTLTVDGSPVIPTSWSSTSLVLSVPDGLAAGDHAIFVTVGGQTSSAASFTVTPFISNASPSPVTGGTTVTLTGTSFGAGQGGSTLLVGGVSLAGSPWANLSLGFVAPTSITAGTIPVLMTVNGELSNAGTFVVDPSIYALTPVTGAVSSTVTLTGANFGATKDSSSVTVNGITAATTAWSSTSIDITVPASLTAGSYDVVALINGRTSNAKTFNVAAGIASVTPGSGAAGTWITVSGTAFGASQGSNEVSVGGVAVLPATWTTSSIQFSIPATVPAGVGSISLTIGGLTTTYAFTVDVGTLSLGSANATGGDTVTITGTNFGTNLGGVSVTVGGVAATVNTVSATSIDFEMPDTVTGGTQNVIVTINGEVSAPVTIKVIPSLVSALPAIRTGGDSITLTGTNFGVLKGSSTVVIDGVVAATTAWGDLSIVATMPDTVTAGTTRDVWVVVGGETSGTVSLTVNPSLGTLSPSSSSAGNTVTLSGTNFGGAQGTSTFTLAGIAVTTTSWSQTSINWTVPNGAPVGSQPLVLTVNGRTVNTTFTVTIGISLSPNAGTGGTLVTINGTGFGALQGASNVTFANVPVTAWSWSDIAIQFQVPITVSAGAQPVTVTVGAQSNDSIFTLSPNILSLSPDSGTGGTLITLAGTNLGDTQSGSTILIDGTPLTALSWSTTSASFEVPDNIAAGTHTISVTVGGQTDTFSFDVDPAVGTLDFYTGSGGKVITATGTNFGSTQGASNIFISGIPVIINVNSWYASVVTFTIPNDVTAGVQNLVFNVGSQLSTPILFTVTPTLDTIFPLGGTSGTSVVLTGTNFGLDQGSSSLTLGGVPLTVANVNWSQTAITFTVPATIGGGDKTLSLTVGGQTGNNLSFKIAPSVSSVSPSTVSGGTVVTVTGANFGTPQGASTVRIGGMPVTVTNWYANVVTFTVANSVTGGTHNLTVTVGSELSNATPIVVVPDIDSLTPASGPGLTSVVISGSGFGSAQGSSTVRIGGVLVTPSVWSDTSLTFAVPTNVEAGSPNVEVTVGGQTSAASLQTTFALSPSISALNPTSGSHLTAVTVTGANFGAVQNLSTISLGGIDATVTGWSPLAVTFTVSAAITGGTHDVVVRVGSRNSNAQSFTVNPLIGSLSPSIGSAGTVVTVSGNHFGPVQGPSTISIGGFVTLATGWSPSAVTFAVPSAVTAGVHSVIVRVGGADSNPSFFDVNPTLLSLSPGTGTGGDSIVIYGTNFGSVAGTVAIGGTNVIPFAWSSTAVTVVIPNTIPAGTRLVELTVSSITVSSNLTVKPTITLVNPLFGSALTSVTVTGTNFGSSGVLSLGGITVLTGTWADTSITFSIPATIAAGTRNIVVTSGSQVSYASPFTVTPNINTLSPSSGSGSTVVTVTGTNFGVADVSSTLTIGGLAVTPSLWNDTTVIFTVPNDITGGTQSVVITVGGQTDSASFGIAPSITSLSPTSGKFATLVSVTGKNFGSAQGGSTITIDGVAASATAWSPLAVTFSVPAAVTGGTRDVRVIVGSQTSNTSPFIVTPSINLIGGLSLTYGPGGTSVTINGFNFGGAQGSSTVAVGGIPATVTSWSASSVVITMPNDVTGGTRGVVVTVGGQASNASDFTVKPKITLLSPLTGAALTPVVITGTNFGDNTLPGTVTIGGVSATVTSWSMNSVAITIPNGVTAGTQNVVVTAGGELSDGSPFTVTPTISGLNPTTGTGNTVVTVSGVNFGTSQGASTLSIGGFSVAPSAWYASTVTFTVPNAVTGGTRDVILTIGGQASNTSPFLVRPTISSLSAAAVTGGTSVTLSGTNFGATQGSGTVTVGGIGATVTSWGASSVVITMPNNVTAGTRSVVLTAGGEPSIGNDIFVNPGITLLAPLTGSGDTVVTITGTNFGDNTLPGTVTIGGVSAVVNSWSMNSISFTIPHAVPGGTQNVVVTNFGRSSNTSAFTVKPTITGLNPLTGSGGSGGTTVTISGTNFGTVAGTVTIGGVAATTSGWYAGTVTFSVPSAVTSGTQSVLVSVGGQNSNGLDFTVTPSITGLSPTNGIGGIAVTISGTNFGDTQGTSRVSVGGFTATATSWGSGSIDITMPSAVTGGTQSLVVTVNGQSVSTTFNVKPSITSLTPSTGTGQTAVVIAGTGFGTVKGASTVTVAGVLVSTSAWSSGSISFTMPNTITAQTAPVVVTVGSQASVASSFALAPNFTVLSPTAGGTGTPVTLTGTNFGTAQGTSTVMFGLTSATVTGWYNTTITATVPVSLGTGNHTVTIVVGGQTSNGQSYAATASFLISSAETLDCDPVDGHVDHYKITYNETVNDSTFEGYTLNSEGSVTNRWEVAGRLNVRLHHGSSLPAICGIDTANDAVQYLKFTADSSFDTGEKPEITTTAALITALTAPAGRTMFGTGTIGSTDLVETDKAAPFVYYARGFEAGASEALVGPGDRLELRFSETTNAASLGGIDLDTAFALTTFFDFGSAADIASTVWTQTDVTNDTLIVTFATATPTIAIGNTVKARGTDIFDLAGNLPTAIANVLTPPVIAGTFNAGANGPYVTDADYFDIDADGHLDHVRVTFSGNVDDSTFPGYTSTVAVGTVTALWQVANYTNVAIDPTVAADVDDDNVIWLSFAETSVYDTGEKPDLTATANAAQLRDAALCYFNANNVGTACTDSTKAVLASADVNEGDKAPPIIMHATGKVGSDKIFVLFSENVWSATGRPSCTAGGQFTEADFSYGVILAGGASSIVDMDVDVCAATDALVTLLADTALTVDDVNFDMAKPNNGAAIYDQADNAMVATTSRVIEGTTAPYLVGASSFKVGANFFIRVVYSEDVNATQALTAANYSVIEDPASTCADIAATPTSVLQVSGNIYDIQTGTQCGSTPLTFYRVTVNNVTDANEGELIGIPNIATTLGTDTVDITPPRLLEAKAITPTTVQLTFSEPMRTGNVNGTAECAAAGYPLTCAVDADLVAGGTQLKYTLLPTLGAVTSVLKTANSSVFILTHTSIQSGTFYSLTAVDTATLTGQLLDATGVRIGSVPRNQATFQGMGALITQAADGPLFNDPFGDGTTNNFAFTYASRVYIGPNGPNNGEFRFEADGANPLSVEFVGPSAGVTCMNSVSFGVVPGAGETATCMTPTSPPSAPGEVPTGPDGEEGVVGFNAGSVTVAYAGGGGATTTREVLMVGPIKGNIQDMYFSEDVDTSLNFKQCAVSQSAGNNSQSVQIAYAWGANMYVGISSGHNTAAPFLNKIPLTAASATAPLACGTTVDLNIKDVDDMGNTGGPNNPARGGAVGHVGIDSMLYVPALPTPANRFYIANNGGMAASTGEPTSDLSFTMFKNQASFAAASASAGDNFTLIVDDLGKVSPGRKGIPQMVVYKDVMFLARNVATNQSPGTVSNGGELWKCSANCTTAASWTRILSSTTGIGSNTGMEIVANQAISMLQVSQGYLYVGFDNMTDGARMYRTSIVPTNLNDFTEIGRIASGVKTHTDGSTLACSHGQSLGGVCMGYQILSSSVITKNQYSYIYFTVGCTLKTASLNGGICDVNLTAAITLPAMSVLIQRD